MGMFIEPVRIGLQESVRRITVRVFWNERKRPEQSIEVVTYVTDPAKLDLALSLGQGLSGTGGTTGTSSSSTSKSITGAGATSGTVKQ